MIDLGQLFSELWHHEDCAHKENGTVSVESWISGPWHSIGLGISGRVLRTYYLTCPGRVLVPPLNVTPLLEHLDWQWCVKCKSNEINILIIIIIIILLLLYYYCTL